MLINCMILRHIPIILFFCLASLTLTSCGSQKTIVNALDEKEANEILVFLNSKGIQASKTQNTSAGGGGGGTKIVLWDITVSPDQANEAMALLNANGLPRRRGQSLLGIFAGQGLVPSEMEQKIRYQAGLAEQIATVIRKIDGVLEADVQLSFPEEDPLNPEKKGKVTASVYVKHSGVLDDPNSHLMTKIKRLVASSVPGLSYDDVTVISDRARFSEISPLNSQGSVIEDQKDYVSIWSIVIAKDSTTRFRIVFFTFSILILLLILLQIWIVWKFYPLIQKSGGVKSLFSIHPAHVEEKAAETPSEEQVEEQVEKEEGEQIVKGEESGEPEEKT